MAFENNSCSTISALAAYLYKLLQDEELFLKYFEWRKSYNVYRWHFIENLNFSVFIYITAAASPACRTPAPSVTRSSPRSGKLQRSEVMSLNKFIASVMTCLCAGV